MPGKCSSSTAGSRSRPPTSTTTSSARTSPRSRSRWHVPRTYGDLLSRKGDAHERAFLQKLRAELRACGYEPVDAKLARGEKPTYLLQLCFYAEGIAAIQGVAPEHLHVLLGQGERRTLRHDHFAAYYRRVRQSFERATRDGHATEPYPVEHCRLCQFRRSAPPPSLAWRTPSTDSMSYHAYPIWSRR